MSEDKVTGIVIKGGRKPDSCVACPYSDVTGIGIGLPVRCIPSGAFIDGGNNSTPICPIENVTEIRGTPYYRKVTK